MAASREEIAERVKEVLVEQLGIDENNITEEASFQEDLDADSLDLVELPKKRLRHAFTHASWAGDRSDSYERLEFLGDSVLGLAIAQELYERFPTYQEGRLAKIRAHVVSRQSCAVVGRRLELGKRLGEAAETGDAEEIAKLASNRNVLAALVEASLGALYLEHGFEAIREAIVGAFADRID